MKIEKRNNSYTCRIYDKIRKKEIRLTAKTRQELLQKVNSYKSIGTPKMSIGQTLESYISLKENVLSPSTIRGYFIYKKAFKEFEDIPINSLTPIITQEIVNSWIRSGACPKTIRNRFSLLKVACKLYDVDVSATLPQQQKPQLVNPTEQDINTLLSHYKGTFMEVVILLAIYGTLRVGEICALQWSDLKGNVVSINKTLCIDKNDKPLIKNSPKTYAGFREVELPQIVVDKINSLPHESEFIIQATPKQISDRFHRVVKKLGLPAIRFHDLRHYSASYLHALGIPDKYIIKRGGWETESIMRKIYQSTIDEQEKQVNELISKSVVSY